MNDPTLLARLANANQAFELYDFGGEVVHSSQSWVEGSPETGKITWRKRFVLGKKTFTFIVRFLFDSTDVDEAYILNKQDTKVHRTPPVESDNSETEE